MRNKKKAAASVKKAVYARGIQGSWAWELPSSEEDVREGLVAIVYHKEGRAYIREWEITPLNEMSWREVKRDFGYLHNAKNI